MSGLAQSRSYRTGFTTTAVARHSWPADCFIQGGVDGVVLQSGCMSEAFSCPAKGVEAIAAAMGVVNPPGYRTAFFEAFPRSPKSFLRGEGNTLAEAEDACWKDWQQILACPGHEFGRGHYRSGAGICKYCGVFNSSAFNSTLDPCVRCGDGSSAATFGPDRHGRWHCKKCFPLIPEDDKSDIHRRLDSLRAKTAKETKPA